MPPNHEIIIEGKYALHVRFNVLATNLANIAVSEVVVLMYALNRISIVLYDFRPQKSISIDKRLSEMAHYCYRRFICSQISVSGILQLDNVGGRIIACDLSMQTKPGA